MAVLRDCTVSNGSPFWAQCLAQGCQLGSIQVVSRCQLLKTLPQQQVHAQGVCGVQREVPFQLRNFACDFTVAQCETMMITIACQDTRLQYFQDQRTR